MKNIAIIVAAGESLRFSRNTPKQYSLINDKPILRWSIETFLSCKSIDNILVVINKKHINLYKNATKGLNLLDCVIGGKTRKESVFLGLKAIEKINPENVLIHDAARPLISKTLIEEIILKLDNYQAVDIGIKLTDTIKQFDIKNNIKIIDRNFLYRTQTPQGFKYRLILDLHKNSNTDYTDDISLCFEKNIDSCKIDGEINNIKITNKHDFEFCKFIMSNKKVYRTGIGLDVHKFSKPLKDTNTIKICGIDVKHNQSIIAHSDGDVGLHAITEALLGSMALGNIGQLFPPNNNKYKNIDSSYFLEYTKKKLKQIGVKILNIDLTIICEKPKIMPYSQVMRENIAKILEINSNQVSVKATTTEKMGFLGSQEGIAAQAICCVTN